MDKDDNPANEFTEEPIPDELADLPEVAICPDCMAPNHPAAHFCDKCNAPLSSHAAIDPIGQIYSQGYIYRKAIRGRTSLIMLIGMLLIFWPSVILLFLGPINLYRSLTTPGQWSWSGFAGSLLSGLYVILGVAILVKVTASFIHNLFKKEDANEADGDDFPDQPESEAPEETLVDPQQMKFTALALLCIITSLFSLAVSPETLVPMTHTLAAAYFLQSAAFFSGLPAIAVSVHCLQPEVWDKKKDLYRIAYFFHFMMVAILLAAFVF